MSNLKQSALDTYTFEQHETDSVSCLYMCVYECVYACNNNNQRAPQFKKKEWKAGRVEGKEVVGVE